MFNFIKRYWDLLGGAITGIGLAVLADFKLESVQLCYSVIILMLVSIGAFRVIRQETEKQRNKRDHTLVDSMVDSQKPIKAVSLATEPLSEGSKTGKLILFIIGGLKKMKEKLKVFFSKYKGYVLTAALAILTAIEWLGGYINELFGGVLTIRGVEVLPMVTLLCTAIVGAISNGYTPEEMCKIKNILTNSSTNASAKNTLIKSEIKKTLKEKTAIYHQLDKQLKLLEHEKTDAQNILATANTTLEAKREMANMNPPLATETDVRAAIDNVIACQDTLKAVETHIREMKARIANIHTSIEALKNQL